MRLSLAFKATSTFAIMRLFLLMVTKPFLCYGDLFVAAPTPSDPIGGSNYTGTFFPFVLQATSLSTNSFFTMRYQQVYNRSLFTNAAPDLIYVASLLFFHDSTQTGTPVAVSVRKMQINLSTTSRAADSLSSVFADNVGPDDTVVFGPANYQGGTGSDPTELFVPLNRPFQYDPTHGNLLLDIRILDGSGPPPFPPGVYPRLEAWSSSTDESSRLWSTNVAAAVADGKDTVALSTVIQLAPIPSLRVEFDPQLCTGCPSNLVVVRWPPQPTNFVIQTSDIPSGTWRTPTNQVFGNADPLRGGWFIQMQAGTAGQLGLYRLFWSGN